MQSPRARPERTRSTYRRFLERRPVHWVCLSRRLHRQRTPRANRPFNLGDDPFLPSQVSGIEVGGAIAGACARSSASISRITC